jgi:hypothetical protein
MQAQVIANLNHAGREAAEREAARKAGREAAKQ